MLADILVTENWLWWLKQARYEVFDKVSGSYGVGYASRMIEASVLLVLRNDIRGQYRVQSNIHRII